MGSNPTEVRDFFSFSVWVHFLSWAIAQKVSFGGIHYIALLYTALKPLYQSVSDDFNWHPNITCNISAIRQIYSQGKIMKKSGFILLLVIFFRERK